MILKGTTIAALLALAANIAFAATPHAQGRQAAVWPTSGWEVTTPEEQGMSSRAIADLVDNVGAYKQDSLLIVRNGRMIVDAYYAPYVTGIRHDLRSVTKSFVATIIGVLVQQGKLESIDRPVLELFPDRTFANPDDRKKAMTVRHLLDMASGFAWVERFYTPDETVIRMYKSPDPVRFVLDQPMSDTPGANFIYKGGDPYLLSALVNKLTGQNALEFAKEELFAPLGITDVRWGPVDKQGIVTGEAGLRLTPHDMAKLGYLYLRDGLWADKRIIPSAWIERARKGNVTTPFGKYANLWWSVPENDVFMALGRHGQFVIVLPKLDVVAVLTGIVPDGESRFPWRALVDQITAAIKSNEPLPPDQEGVAALKASLVTAATEKPTHFGSASTIADTVSSKTWRVRQNELRVKAVRLNLVGESPTFELTIYPLKEGGDDIRLSEPLGLDGRWRGKSAPYAFVVNKGNWLDNRTFLLERRFLGDGVTVFWTFTFEEGRLKLQFRNTDGYIVELPVEAPN